MAIDPVCNMIVEERDPPAIATLVGHTYYFCELACKQAFLELHMESSVEAQPRYLVDSQGKPLFTQRTPKRVVAILFTDVENSTQLMHEVGQETAHRIVLAELDQQQRAIQLHGGYAVKRLGDGIMAAFAAPRSALLCAAYLQSDGAREAKIRIRIGLHAGDVMVDGDDYFGKTVIMASRITARAHGGEIVVSEGFRSLIDPPGGWRFGPSRRVRLKGFPGWQRITILERAPETTGKVAADTERRDGS